LPSLYQNSPSFGISRGGKFSWIVGSWPQVAKTHFFTFISFIFISTITILFLSGYIQLNKETASIICINLNSFCSLQNQQKILGVMILWLSYYEIIKHTTFYVLLTCIKKVYCQTLKNAIIRLELKGRYIHRITLYIMRLQLLK
jgi:hypothetical protein